jgi:hypothetical protein
MFFIECFLTDFQKKAPSANTDKLDPGGTMA